MTKQTILRKDGTPSPYFWVEQDRSEPTRKTVYKDAAAGIKRMTGVHFDSVAGRIQKH
jgi:hypothetical protein